MTTQYRAEFLLPGLLFPESAVRPLDEPDPTEALSIAPDAAFCFTIYEVSTPPDLGPEFTVTPVARNRTARFYIGGDVFTLAEVEAMGGHEILVSNMRANDWDRMVRCRTGNWQPLEEGDVVLSEVTT